MDAMYEVVFFGTDATGREGMEVMQRVGTLLRLDETKLNQLFASPQGVTLMRTDTQGKAEQLAKALRAAGALCNVRIQASSEADWSKWELEDPQKSSFKKFSCPSCHYTQRLPLEAEEPETCPKCGIVLWKAHEHAQRNQAKAAMRERILREQRTRKKIEEDAAQSKEEQRLRKEIEKELRQELGLHKKHINLSQSVAIAAGMLALGVGGTVGFYTLNAEPLPQSQVAATGSVPAQLPQPAEIAQRSLVIAEGVMKNLANSSNSLVMEPAIAGFTPLTRFPVTMVGEPWNALPATASGSKEDLAGEKARQRGNTSPIVVGSPSQENGKYGQSMEELMQHWLDNAEDNPNNRALQLHALRNNLASFSYISPEQIMHLPASPQEKVNLLARLTPEQLSNADSTDAPLMHRVAIKIARLARPGDKASVDSLQQFIQNAVAETWDTIQAQLFVPAALANKASPQTLAAWFDLANTTLESADSDVRLRAVARMSQAYHHANDTDTARALLREFHRHLVNFPDGKPKQNLSREWLDSYSLLGFAEQASQFIRSTHGKSLQADLALAHLANTVAANDQLLTARAVAGTIRSPEVKTRTLAQLSVIHTLAGHFGHGMALYEEAEKLLSSSSQEFLPLLSSDLLLAGNLLGLPEPTFNSNLNQVALLGIPQQEREQSLRLISTNLAWTEYDNLSTLALQTIGKNESRKASETRFSQLRKLRQALNSLPTRLPKVAGNRASMYVRLGNFR